jgi:phosphate transport system substrate-binding protein
MNGSGIRWLLVATMMAVMGTAGAEELSYDGATTIGKKIMPEASAAFQAKSGHKFSKIDLNGTGKGLKAALAGQVSVAGVSRSLTAEELAQKPHFEVIGYDALGVFVNEKNPVKVLTKAQLKGIFTGKIKNWKEVGGADLPIIACSESPTGGRATVDAFKNMVLDGEPFGPLKVVDDASDCVKGAASTPGLVGPATMAYAEPGARALPVDGVKPTPDDVRAGNYLLSRPLLLVAKAKPDGALKAFFTFVMSPEGQKIVARSFVSVR